MTTWDDAASWYLKMVGDSDTGFNDLAADIAVELLGQCQGKAVLDLGCGEGHVARRLARSGAKVVGVDPTKPLLDFARAAESKQPLGIDFRLEAAEHLRSLDDSSLDAVVSVLALHHVKDLRVALSEVHRVLRPGGRFCVVIPHP